MQPFLTIKIKTLHLVKRYLAYNEVIVLQSILESVERLPCLMNE